MTYKGPLIMAALLAALACVLGAFGAHAFKTALAQLGGTATYETAVRFQMYHALGLLAVGLLKCMKPDFAAGLVTGLFLSGVLLFSGSLYVLSFDGPALFGPVTPLGGALLIAAWLAFSLRVYQLK